jgi:hypothetical protein
MHKKAKAGKPKVVQPSITLTDLMDQFSTEDACKAYLRDARWPHGVVCPRCGNVGVYELKSKPFHWQCQSGATTTNAKGKQVTCKSYRFSVTSGSIFENTKYPLRQWFQVAYLICQSKKGISALQIHRQIRGGDYRTAWYMCHRIRSAMQGDALGPLGEDGSEVEMDETYIGGKETNKHLSQRNPKNKGSAGKTPVIGAIARKGNVVCKAITRLGFSEQAEWMREAVSTKARFLATDESPFYVTFEKDGYERRVVNHKAHQYVVGTTHTQNIESFWSLLKRGIMGSYHKVSDSYLPLYLNEFSWRFNNRNNPDIFRDLLSSV